MFSEIESREKLLIQDSSISKGDEIQGYKQ